MTRGVARVESNLLIPRLTHDERHPFRAAGTLRSFAYALLVLHLICRSCLVLLEAPDPSTYFFCCF